MDKEAEKTNQIGAIGFLGRAIEKISDGRYEDAITDIYEAYLISTELSDVYEYGREENNENM